MTMSEPPELQPYLGAENDDIDLSGTPLEPEADEPENVGTDEQDSPAPEQEEAAPEAAPPAPDLNASLTAMIELQRNQMEAQQRQAEEARRQAAEQQQRASAPKPLMEQEEWTAQYDEAMSAAAYDPTARQTLMRMNRELAQEQAQQMMNSFRGDMQLQMRADQVLRQSVEASRTQYGDLVTAEDFDAVAAQVFGDDRANIARALDPQYNPQAAQTRQMLAWAAMGKAQAEGRSQRPAPTTPPPNPRTAARTQPGKPAPKNDMWADEDYVNGVYADLWSRK